MPALDVRLQAEGRAPADFSGIVDSGATHTALSLADAEELGLSKTDLRESGTIIVADERSVPSFTTTVPIRGQVHNQSLPGGPLEPWGPVFQLHPIFLPTGTPLWGQEDFCATFRVTLERYLNPAHFVLEHWTDMGSGSTPR